MGRPPKHSSTGYPKECEIGEKMGGGEVQRIKVKTENFYTQGTNGEGEG